MSTRLRSAIFGAGWGLADQGLSSVTNFGLGIVAARELGPEAFGIFSVAFASYILVLGASRSISSEPLTVRYSHSPVSQMSGAISRAAGVSAATGAVAAVASLVASLFLNGDLKNAFLALGVVLPGLMLQDFWRFAFFSSGRGRSAFLNDLTWAVVLIPILALAVADDVTSPSSYILIWGLSGLVAALTGLVQIRVLPRPTQSFMWLREQRDLAPRFAFEFIGSSGLSQVALYLIGAIAGLASVGTLRAAQMLLGPVTVLFQGLRLAATPEGVRTARMSSRKLLHFGVLMSVGLFAGALAWGICLLQIPDQLGIWLLKESWAPAREVVPILALGAAGSGLSSGAAVGLRSLAAASRSLRATWITGILTVTASSVGAAIAATTGAAVGIAVAVWSGTAVWWREFLSELEGGGAQSSAASPIVGPIR